MFFIKPTTLKKKNSVKNTKYIWVIGKNQYKGYIYVYIGICIYIYIYLKGEQEQNEK